MVWPCVTSRQRLFYSYVLTLQMDIEDYRDSNAYLSLGLPKLRNSYTMGCPPVRGDNPRALASG